MVDNYEDQLIGVCAGTGAFTVVDLGLEVLIWARWLQFQQFQQFQQCQQLLS